MTTRNPGAQPLGFPRADFGIAVDRRAAVARVGGNLKLLGNLLDQFLRLCPPLVETLRAAAERGSAEDLRRVAHSLRSAVATFGAQAATDLATQLEHLGRSGDLSTVGPALSAFERAFGQLAAELRQWREELAP